MRVLRWPAPPKLLHVPKPAVGWPLRLPDRKRAWNRLRAGVSHCDPGSWKATATAYHQQGRRIRPRCRGRAGGHMAQLGRHLADHPIPFVGAAPPVDRHARHAGGGCHLLPRCIGLGESELCRDTEAVGGFRHVRQARKPKDSSASSANSLPIAGDAVAPGEGAFRTCTASASTTSEKSSTRVPSRRMACARTPDRR